MPPTAEVVSALIRRRESVCTVESLTGGLLCAHLTEVPGASQVVRGGLVAYTIDAKRDVVSVDPSLLTAHGAVSSQAAVALADRARDIFGSTWALSTTGVAGPSEQEGKAIGTVFVAVAGPRSEVMSLHLSGDRQSIREQTCCRALELIRTCLE